MQKRQPPAKSNCCAARATAEKADQWANVMTTSNDAPILMPFTILVSGAEQARYWFADLRADANRQNRPLAVPSEWAHLPTGDYTIRGLEKLILIERKSKEDLFGTLGNQERRERFRREHQRLSHVDFGAVVIEADMAEILTEPPERSELNPKTVFRTFCAWTQRYGVHWIFASDRQLAEIVTFRLLQKYWENHYEHDSTTGKPFTATAGRAGSIATTDATSRGTDSTCGPAGTIRIAADADSRAGSP